MSLAEILTLVFGLATTILGILLKAEYDKRTSLQQQVATEKRKIYSAFNDAINDLLSSAIQKDPTQGAERAAKELMGLRHGIWQYGSD